MILFSSSGVDGGNNKKKAEESLEVSEQQANELGPVGNGGEEFTKRLYVDLSKGY